MAARTPARGETTDPPPAAGSGVTAAGQHHASAPATVHEIFLSDQSGQLVAISEITSDYWQADEDDFQQAQRLAPGQVHIGNIEYDGSTQSFQSKVSAPIHDPEDGRLLGVLSLGINIETAFGDNLR